MSKPTYRAAIIGLGFIGGADQVSGDALGQQVSRLDGTHLGALSGNPRLELVAGSSRDEGRRERFAERTGARTYADWQEMLDREPLDLVSIATYAPCHAPMTIACADRGIRAIYCEKPIATRLSDADKMISACRHSGSLLVINHNRRFNPNYRSLRDGIAAGELGQLTSASLQWGSGRLGNVGTHLIDALCMLTGRRVASVSGTLDPAGRPDCRGPQFRDPGGWGVLKLTRAADGSSHDDCSRSDGVLMATVDAADYACVPPAVVLNGTKVRAMTGRGDVRIEWWDGKVEEWPPPGASGTAETETGLSSMDRAAAEIVAWLDGGAPFSYPAQAAVETLEAIVGLHVSHDRGAEWVDLPLAGSDRDREVRSG